MIEAQRVADEKRAANVAHQRKINQETRAALVEIIKTVASSTSDWEVETAHAIVVAMAKGLVPHARITY